MVAYLSLFGIFW